VSLDWLRASIIISSYTTTTHPHNMELLLRTNFDIPKPPGGVFDPLRYLSLGSGQQDSMKEEQKSTSATAVYEVARPILQGCHAIPTKLKILLDRALSALSQEEVLMIVSGCGWQLDDYQRGYKLKDPSGSPLDRWNMCSKMEEPILLKQFLCFRETRTITQQLIIQDFAERSFNPFLDQNRADLQNKFAKSQEESFISRTRSPELKKESLLQMVTQCDRSYKDQSEGVKSPKREVVESPLSPPPPPKQPVSPVSSIAPPAAVVPSPGAPIFPRSMSNGIPLPPSTMSMSNLMSNNFPMFPFPGLPGSLSTPNNPAPKEGVKEQFNGALNLTRSQEKSMEREQNELDSDSGSRRSSVDDNQKRAQLPEDIGITYVSPSTGKKRVQCNVCMKTFCDKGALKIHFSAVHLREMHKCTVQGCTMMFSSRRSRNRHSANPNPKLHTPQVKRRISQHDGRTHPGPPTPGNITPILPKENRDMPKENNFQVPNFPSLGQSNNQSPGMPHLAFPGLPGFNPFMPPDLKALQQDLQRFSDLQKLYAQNENSDQSSCQKYDSDSEIHRSNDNMMDTGNRKRKSQNPTKRPHLEMEDNDHISSDSASDEGFPDPMMEDDDDDLDNVSSGDEAA